MSRQRTRMRERSHHLPKVPAGQFCFSCVAHMVTKFHLHWQLGFQGFAGIHAQLLDSMLAPSDNLLVCVTGGAHDYEPIATFKGAHIQCI